MVMESAHNIGENTNNIEAVSLPEFTKDGDTSLDKIYASVARYSRFYNEKDSESLTSEFIENGVRSVSSSDGIHIGSEQIKESLMMDSDNSLQATVLGYKKLSESSSGRPMYCIKKAPTLLYVLYNVLPLLFKVAA